MTATATRPRRADPWRDLSVIDRNAPRTNQAFVGIVSLAALLTGAQWLVGLLALQLALGLTLGRRWCLPCVLYFTVIQPRIGEGELEDSRAPRFANRIALTLTGGAALLFAVGATGAGWVLAGTVAAVALFSAASGFCVGCWIYARVWGCETCELPARSG
jgi:hypothetical protein